jgi:hypothetical protein
MITIKGHVLDVQEQSGTSEKGDWKRVTVVVETADKYNNTVPVQFFNPEFSVKKGDEVEVRAYVGGREYKGKYFSTIDGRELSVLSGGQQAPPKAPTPSSPKEEAFENDTDDLPF